jgi:DNA-directed RNA polymerase subunit RPC12/RpoP
MPFQFICSKCKAVLAEVADINLKLNNYRVNRGEKPKASNIEYYIHENIGSHCPHCGHKLCFPPVKVDVTPIRKVP